MIGSPMKYTAKPWTPQPFVMPQSLHQVKIQAIISFSSNWQERRLMRKEKALDHTKSALEHTKRALEIAKEKNRILESKIDKSSEELTTARLEMQNLQRNEKPCKVCYMPLADRPVVAMRRCRHVFCQQCINQVAKEQGNETHVRCPYCNGTPDRWVKIFL